MRLYTQTVFHGDIPFFTLSDKLISSPLCIFIRSITPGSSVGKKSVGLFHCLMQDKDKDDSEWTDVYQEGAGTAEVQFFYHREI